MDIQKRLDAKEALDFLRDHPALNNNGANSSFCCGLYFMMMPCCKHNLCQWAGTDGITMYYGEDGWEKYKDLFDIEFLDYDESYPKTDINIKIPYEQIHGEPWKYDHMEYWYEMSFYVFTGNPYVRKDSWNPKNWDGHCGPEGGANTFEDMLIEAASEIKKAFGDFQMYNSFYTPSEIACHKNETPFYTKDTEDKNLKTMIFNDKYVDISDGLINLRWLQWFMTTEYAKTNWDFNMSKWSEYVDKIEKLEPEKHKKILKKYENINT